MAPGRSQVRRCRTDACRRRRLATRNAVPLGHGRRAETVALADIEWSEVHGPSLEPAVAIAAVDPVRLALDAQLPARAVAAGSSTNSSREKPAFDPGRIETTGARDTDGSHVVKATVFDRQGRPLFSTAGTRWNLHGGARFENGSTLYLPHPDHPTMEQRILIWPPDTGTFDSLAEARPLAALRRELEWRDSRLSRRPARIPAPPAAWYRAIRPVYPRPYDESRARMFGPEKADFERCEIRVVRRPAAGGRKVRNPCLIDVASETILFPLIDTARDGEVERTGEEFVFTLEDTGASKAVVRFIVDPRRLSARLADQGTHGRWASLNARCPISACMGNGVCCSPRCTPDRRGRGSRTTCGRSPGISAWSCGRATYGTRCRFCSRAGSSLAVEPIVSPRLIRRGRGRSRPGTMSSAPGYAAGSGGRGAISASFSKE